MESISPQARESLYALAQLFIGIDPEEAITLNGDMIPKKFHEAFKAILKDVNEGK